MLHSDGNCHVIQGGPSAEQRCSEDKVWRRLRFCHPSRASMRWTHSLAVAPPPANEGVGLGCTGLSLILAVKDGLGSFNFVSISRVCGTHALGSGIDDGHMKHFARRQTISREPMLSCGRARKTVLLPTQTKMQTSPPNRRTVFFLR